MKTTLQQPIEKEIEKYSEEDYDNMLDETYGDFMNTYPASRVLKEVDPIAYNCGFSDFQEYDTIYECPICGSEYNDEEDALYCCQDEE